MVKDEKMLEELYELLTLYFEFSPHGGSAKPFENPHMVEPALDRVIFKEYLFARITGLLVGGE